MTRADLLAALRKAMQFLEEHHRELLAPRPTWVQGTKRLGELAALAELLIDSDLLTDHGREWLRACWQVSREGEFFADVVAADDSFITLAITYAPFARHGLRNTRLEQRLTELAVKPAGAGFVPFGAACALARLQLPSAFDLDALLAQQWCMRSSELTSPDAAQVYETTHVVMWLHALDRIPHALRQRLAACGPSWIARFRAAHNLDVVAELVMMEHHLGRCAPAGVWAWLLERQDADGAFHETDVPTRALGRFHATLAAALALTSCLSSRSCGALPGA